MDYFKEYKKLGEPDKLRKSLAWQTAIGLQQVDGLTPSKYLIKTAKQHINGDISIDEVEQRLKTYYKSRPATTEEEQKKEADEVSARITKILGEKTFTFSPAEYITIHKRLFSGVLDNKIAGKIRKYNIEKSEWVLNGDTVMYASVDSIKSTLDYDFAQEKAFKYNGLDNRAFIEHFAKFISGIWQIHAFGEGNTRATAVFAIKYLRTQGWDAENDLFRDNSWYFRNALVRANYNDHKNGIHATMKYLTVFFDNLLLGKKHRLRNRDLQVVIGGKKKTTRKTTGKTTIKTSDKIIAILRKNPETTMPALADMLGITVDGVKWQLDKMRKLGIIRRAGSRKIGNWEIAADNK